MIRSQFAALLNACRAYPVLLYQSVRRAESAQVQVGYFASAYIEHILPAADGPGYVAFLKDVQALEHQFGEGLSRFGQGQKVHGWHAAADVREIGEDEFLELIRNVRQTTFELPSSGDRIVIPRFRTRRERVRDRKFRERVYRAYGGRCAISGVAHMSRNGLCGLEAAHIVPRLLSPHERAFAGILLAPSWHSLFDCGNIVIHDDFSWTAVIEDHDTRGITDKRLRLPAFQDDWPDRELLEQKRSLYAW
ncbi:HNH endonuclease [Devosia riboflavina]